MHVDVVDFFSQNKFMIGNDWDYKHFRLEVKSKMFAFFVYFYFFVNINASVHIHAFENSNI